MVDLAPDRGFWAGIAECRAESARPGLLTGVLTSRPMKVLVLFAHPALERSRVNRAPARRPRAIGARASPSTICTRRTRPARSTCEREQELLLEHDVIVFQHPFYWYSTPAILKEWQDLVLEHGWAYGDGGTR